MFYTYIIRETNCLKNRMNGWILVTNKQPKLEFQSKTANLDAYFKPEQQTFMKSITLPWVIHIFAILHAAVSLCCRFTGVEDQLLLTVLTMAMALIICMKMGLKIEFTAATVIIVNILGFLVGTLGANVLQSFIPSEYAVHSLSTFITTEILGWSIVGITSIFGQKEVTTEEFKSTPYMKWVLLMAAGIFILRLIFAVILSRTILEQDIVFDMIRKVMTNPLSLITLICVNIVFIRSMTTRASDSSRISTISLYIGFFVLAILLETFLVGQEGDSFIVLLLISIFTQITVYCVVYMINYAITVQIEMQAEREKANLAQYRYIKLKRQVNPHFLFNSLNVLDCIICEEKSEQASLYTHKLAGIYRYMIKSEDEEIVPLRDELVFVQLYIDLLKVRFPEGFDVKIDVPEEYMARFVLPCSIQLLIENATKHNAVRADNPLLIKIEIKGDSILVSNNIVPKVTVSPSTGLGQQYISHMYMDLSGKPVEIEKNDEYYCVTLPLL